MLLNNWFIYLLLSVILILFIILYLNINASNMQQIESFENEKIAKIKTLEYDINPLWTNKITSIKSKNLVSPISFWSPNLKLTSTLSYFKIGDTISTTNNYNKPDKEIILVKGDIIQPQKFTKIVEIKNTELENLDQTQFQNYIHLATNITDYNNIILLKQNFNNIINILSESNMLNTMRSNMMREVLSNIAIYRYSGISNGFEDSFYVNSINLSNSSFIDNNNNNITTNYTNWVADTTWTEQNNISREYSKFIVTKNTYHDIKNKTHKYINRENINIYSQGISKGSYHGHEYSDDYMLIIPMGFKVNYISPHRNPINIISTPENIDFNTNNQLNINTTINIKPNNQLITNDNNNNIKFNNFIVDYPIEISLNKIINYIDIKNNINNIIHNISNIITVDLRNEFTKALEYIESYINTKKITYHNYVNIITCNYNDYPQYIWNLGDSGYIEISIDNKFESSVSKKIDTINFSFDNNDIHSTNEFSLYLNKINNYINILSKLSSNQINEIPLIIYHPISSDNNYISIGDIVVNKESQLEKFKEYPSMACIPSSCVKNIRPWKTTDIIYENANPYFAIFYNPYIGTFKTVTAQNTLPDGMIQKVVSCIESCKAVDNLIKSDQCAKQISNQNKNVIGNTPIIDTSYYDEEEGYYLDKISRRDNNIKTLKDGIQIIKLRSDQVDSISKAKSRNQLQSYLDTQAANINTVRSNLENDYNTIKLNVNIPANYKIDIVSKVITAISDSNIPNKDDIIAKIIDTQQGKNNYVSKEDIDARMNDILSHCPDINPNLIKKTVINNLCVGCNL